MNECFFQRTRYADRPPTALKHPNHCKKPNTQSTPYAATLSTPSTTFSATEGVLVAPSTMTVFTLATASLTTSLAPSLISPVIESRAAAAAVSTI